MYLYLGISLLAFEQVDVAWGWKELFDPLHVDVIGQIKVLSARLLQSLRASEVPFTNGMSQCTDVEGERNIYQHLHVFFGN